LIVFLVVFVLGIYIYFRFTSESNKNNNNNKNNDEPKDPPPYPNSECKPFKCETDNTKTEAETKHDEDVSKCSGDNTSAFCKVTNTIDTLLTTIQDDPTQFAKIIAVFKTRDKLIEKFVSIAGEKAGIFAEKEVVKKGEEGICKKVAQALGKKILKSLGMEITEDFGTVLVEDGAEALIEVGEGATTDALVGAGVGLTADAAMGPVGAMIGLFDLATMAIDMADPEGYSKLETKEMMDSVRKQSVSALQKIQEKLKTPLPIPGPLFYMDTKVQETAIGAIQQIITGGPDTNTDKTLTDNYAAGKYNHLADIWTSMLKRANGALSSPDNIKKLTDGGSYSTFISDYMKKDKDWKLYNSLLTAELCRSNNGDVITKDKDGNTVSECSYNSTDCKTKWKDHYSKDASGGDLKKMFINRYNDELKHCELQLPGVYNTCVGVGLEYDIENDNCHFTQDYCSQMGADFDNSRGGSCSVNGFQEGLESMFGKTLVRGFRKLFDDNLEPCAPGEQDDGVFCTTTDCNQYTTESELDSGLCYVPCKINLQVSVQYVGKIHQKMQSMLVPYIGTNVTVDSMKFSPFVGPILKILVLVRCQLVQRDG
jgi:hypothetical protein